MRLGQAGSQREHLLRGRFELVHPISDRRGLLGVFSVNGLRHRQVAVILRVDLVERLPFVFGLKGTPLQIDPFIQRAALCLKVFPVRLFATDLVGEKSRVEAKNAGLKRAGDAEAFELSVREPAAQSAKISPGGGRRPSNKSDQCDNERAEYRQVAAKMRTHANEPASRREPQTTAGPSGPAILRSRRFTKGAKRKRTREQRLAVCSRAPRSDARGAAGRAASPSTLSQLRARYFADRDAR